MMEENRSLTIWKFANNFRDIIPVYGYSSSFIELIFMKYISEYTDITLPEEFKTIMNYKNMFISRKFDVDIVKEVFRMIERKFNIEPNLLDVALDNLNNIFTKKEKTIFAALNEFEMPKTKDDMISLLKIVISMGENYDISKTGISSANTSLIKLVNQILDIKEDEIYMDSFAGFSKSSLSVNAKGYIGYELNHSVAAVANMIMILAEKKNFAIRNQSYYLADIDSTANKVFSDGPLNTTLTLEEYHFLGEQSRKSDYYTVKKAVESLKTNGRAVVTCIGGVLFKNDFKKLREQLTLKNLTAVISLPPLWSFSSAPTNLLVFDKERIGNNITMIDASSSDCINKVDKRINELNDESISKIIKSLNGEIIDDFSNHISFEVVLNNPEISWVPVHYIKKKIDIDCRPSKEIKIELKKAYEDLYHLLEKQRKANKPN